MDMVGPSLTRRKDIEMPDMIPVKIRPLSGEAFRPYGQVLERGGLVYPDTDDGRVALAMLQVRRPDANQACTFVNVTRKNAREPATEEGNEARMERIHAARPYVEYVDLQARDDRVLALEW
jgi:hypothetical protein